MKTHTCVCRQLIFFQNAACLRCDRELGFLPDLLRLTSLDPASTGLGDQPRKRLGASFTGNAKITRERESAQTRGRKLFWERLKHQTSFMEV
jgi:hypothetical protein